MAELPDHATLSNEAKRKEVCELINLARQAISDLGDTVKPLDRYMADVADAFAEPDDAIRAAKIEQLNENHADIKRSVDLPDNFSEQEMKTRAMSLITEELPTSKEEMLALAERLHTTGSSLGEISDRLRKE